MPSSDAHPSRELPGVVTDEALTPLWTGLHARFSDGRPVSRVRLDGLGEAARGVLADLLGSARYPGSSIPLTRLDAVLVEIAGHDTRSLVEQLVGPIENRAAQRATAARARQEMWTWLAEHPVVQGQPALLGWVDTLRRTGIGPPAQARPLLVNALTVLDRLPGDGHPLPAFAEQALADPHALDEGTRLSGLVLRAVATLLDTQPPASAEQRRMLWERVGVAEDELSSTVLAAGLRPTGADLLATIARACAAEGHAGSLTLAQIRSAREVRLVDSSTVHVVENPSILALALRRFGPDCPPLVCTSGWPNGAAILLLRRLAEHGVPLSYHGDLDGDGVRIAAYVVAKTGARPWRMGVADYDSSVPSRGPAVGRITSAPWDDALGAAMLAQGVALYEERVSELLLGDLAQEVDRVQRSGAVLPGPGKQALT